MINSLIDTVFDIKTIPRGSVISVATIGSAIGVASTEEGSIKAARKKIKGVKDLKNITFSKMALDKEVNCTVIKDKKTKESKLSCSF